MIEAKDWRARIKSAVIGVFTNLLKLIILLIAGILALWAFLLRLLAQKVKNNPLPTYVISMALMVVICVYSEVKHKMVDIKLSLIIDSLSYELGSVKNISCYDSGYAAGLRKAYLLINNQEDTYGRKIKKKSEFNGERQTGKKAVSEELVQKERGGAQEAHQTSDRMEKQSQGGGKSLPKEKILGKKGI
jgi:hypothetical protein